MLSSFFCFLCLGPRPQVQYCFLTPGTLGLSANTPPWQAAVLTLMPQDHYLENTKYFRNNYKKPDEWEPEEQKLSSIIF